MKITKGKKLKHLRNSKTGYLRENNIVDLQSISEITKCVAKVNVFKVSMKDKLVKKGNLEKVKPKEQQYVQNVVAYICGIEKKPNAVQITESDVKNSLTNYGNNFCIDYLGEKIRFSDIILSQQPEKYEKAKEYIEKTIERRKKLIAKSIINKKIIYVVTNNQLVAQTEKAIWLQSFIVDHNRFCDESVFKQYEDDFGFEKLEKKINENIDNYQGKNITAMHIKRVLTEHIKQFD